jgi:hypothetical protein
VRVGAIGSALPIVAAGLAAMGCYLFADLFSPTESYPPLGTYPDEVLEIPIAGDAQGASFSTIAWDVNSSGRVVGSTNSFSLPRAKDSPTNPIVGFAINVDESDYVDLTPSEGVAAWPSAINDAGLVVGTYKLHLAQSDVLHAYMIEADGTGFVDIHPDGFDSSAALEVTSGGMVVGHVKTLSEQHPVIFPVNGHSLTDLGGTYRESGVRAACDKFIILWAWGELGGEMLNVLYRVEEEIFEVLSVPDVPPGPVAIRAVANDGTIVGWYDRSDYGAFHYRLGEDHAWVISGDILRGDTIYNHFRFCNFTSDGTIVGMAFRSGQIRAAKYTYGVRDVEDVTPGEYSAYSELYSVNQEGWAVGYSGYSCGDENGQFVGVADRAIAVKVK